MFYSKYSDFSPDQIITKNYENVCVHLLQLAKDDKIREKMKRNII